MKLNITGEKVFSILKERIMIGPSSSGYKLAYSADGVNFTEYKEATPADTNVVVNNIPEECYFKLLGNTDTVTIKY